MSTSSPNPAIPSIDNHQIATVSASVPFDYTVTTEPTIMGDTTESETSDTSCDYSGMSSPSPEVIAVNNSNNNNNFFSGSSPDSKNSSSYHHRQCDAFDSIPLQNVSNFRSQAGKTLRDKEINDHVICPDSDYDNSAVSPATRQQRDTDTVRLEIVGSKDDKALVRCGMSSSTGDISIDMEQTEEEGEEEEEEDANTVNSIPPQVIVRLYRNKDNGSKYTNRREILQKCLGSLGSLEHASSLPNLKNKENNKSRIIHPNLRRLRKRFQKSKSVPALNIVPEENENRSRPDSPATDSSYDSMDNTCDVESNKNGDVNINVNSNGRNSNNSPARKRIFMKKKRSSVSAYHSTVIAQHRKSVSFSAISYDEDDAGEKMGKQGNKDMMATATVLRNAENPTTTIVTVATVEGDDSVNGNDNKETEQEENNNNNNNNNIIANSYATSTSTTSSSSSSYSQDSQRDCAITTTTNNNNNDDNNNPRDNSDRNDNKGYGNNNSAFETMIKISKKAHLRGGGHQFCTLLQKFTTVLPRDNIAQMPVVIKDATDVLPLDNGGAIVSDILSNKIVLFDDNGFPKVTFAMETGSEPWSAVVTSDNGSMAATLKGEGCVSLWSPKGESQTDFGHGILASPTGIRFDHLGRFVVADEQKNAVYLFSRTGNFIKEFINQDSLNPFAGRNKTVETLKQPRYICTSRDGLYFLSDSSNQVVKIFDEAGNILNVIGSYGRDDGQFRFPYGVAFDDVTKLLYVADHFNHRVSVFSLDGTFLYHILTQADGITRPKGLAIHNSKLFVTFGNLRAGKVSVYRIHTNPAGEQS